MMKIGLLQALNAEHNWREFFKNSMDPDYASLMTLWDRLEEYVGHKLTTYPSSPCFEMSDEAARRVEMLCGPHYHTVLATYCIKKGIKWK